MAANNLRDIKRRIKSVESTLQITKAMELVASSKLRRAKERALAVKPYFEILYDTLCGIKAGSENTESLYTAPRRVRKRAYLVIAGDKGLAGGYNSNLFKFAVAEIGSGENAVVLPLGRRTAEYFDYRNYSVSALARTEVEGTEMPQAAQIAEEICMGYLGGKYDEVYMVYSVFESAISQRPDIVRLLPLGLNKARSGSEEGLKISGYTTFDPSAGELMDNIVPNYVSGMVYSAVCEAYASENAARRMAMEAAGDNATEIIDTLTLTYNRLRQQAITQEITEIAGGAEALK